MANSNLFLSFFLPVRSFWQTLHETLRHARTQKFCDFVIDYNFHYFLSYHDLFIIILDMRLQILD